MSGTPHSNCTLTTATPDVVVERISCTSSSSLKASSMRSVISFSTSTASMPGAWVMTVKKGASKLGSSARGIAMKAL